MKQRFSSLDVKVIAHELSNTLVNLRLANVYDLSSKIFLFKFAKPDNKQSLLVDSGFRCHITAFARTTAAVPTPFVARLRKYLKTRRVTSLAQVGTDRTIEFQFSDGQYRLFLEFYAGGNIILTDRELNILALLRIVPEGEAQEELRVGLKYSLEDRQNYGGTPALTKDRLRSGLQKAVEKQDGNVVGAKKTKKKAGDALRKALAASNPEFPSVLVDHAMRVVDFDSSLKPEEVLQDESLLGHLMKSLQEAERAIREITCATMTKGYIIAKIGKINSHAPLGEEKNLLYEDFHPFQPRHLVDDPNLEFIPFDGFNKTVDEFFSSIEGQRLESKLQERELNARKKIEAARQEQIERLGGLKEIQTLNERKAFAIQANVDRVQEAMDAVNGLIAQGMDWAEIGKLIELEQKRHNPVAEIFKGLKLQENTITLLLHEGNDDDDNDAGYETNSDVSKSDDNEESKKAPAKQAEDKRLTIDINLGISPWKNSKEYYDNKRSAAVKEQKTLESSKKALKGKEKKIAQDLKKGLKEEKVVLRPIRQQFFFEKFIYFVSSDGYLVLGGKDAQQTEILYRKYLRKGDVYVHADLAGACSIVIRNNSADAPIPPSTLSQAGSLAVSSSSAWDSKAGMPAWWVTADQVSKSTPTGDFLPPGSFMINGKKHFLPPAVLLLGFGLLFHISEESKARHLKHRLHDDSTSGEPPAAGQSLEHQEQDADEDINGGGNFSDKEGKDDDNFANHHLGDVSLSTKCGSDHGDNEEEKNHDDEALANDRSFDASPSLQYDSGHEDDEEESKRSLANPLRTINNEAAHSADSIEQASEALDDLAISDEEEEEDSGPGGQGSTASQNLGKGKQKATNFKGPAPLPRGKRSKAKKMAAKYKDQDEEDRLAAQIVIGAAAGRERAEAEAKAKVQREAELAFQKERRRAQHAKTQKDMAEHEKARKEMLEEGTRAAIEGEDDNMTSLDRLVGTPLPGDEILEVIPVCAPWAALGKYKYKVKIQPGAQKKGKAVKEILGKWTVDTMGKGKVDEKSEDVERLWPREIELIEALKLEECVGIVPVSKMRVMTAGGSSGAAGAKGKGKGKGGKKGGR